MNAAEKLRALGERAADDRYKTIDQHRAKYGEAWPAKSHEAELRAVDILPLVADVVEAAEIAYDGFGEDDHRFYGSQKRLVDALSTLNEALT